MGDQLTEVPTLSSREELDVAVVDLRAGVRGASDQDECAELEGALAGCLLERQDRFGDPDDPSDLNEAVMVLSSALAGASMDHPDRQYWTALLGAAHGLRYELTGEPADRDAGIGYLLDGVSAGEFLPGVFHALLGRLCLDRAEQQPTGDADLGIAITAFTAAMADPDLEPTARCELEVMLGLAHNLRLERAPGQGEGRDLDAAIAWLTAGVDDPAAAEAGLQPMPVRELGRLLWLRGSLPGGTERDRAEAVRRLRQAAAAGSPDDPDRWMYLALLGSVCLEGGIDLEQQRWDSTPEDLNTIVDSFTELLGVLPENPAVEALVPRARLLVALGLAHLQRVATGCDRPGDLEAALDHLEEAAETLSDIQEHVPALRTVGSSILEHCRNGFDPRAARLGVKLLDRVLAELPTDDPARLEVAVELGQAMLTAHELGQLPTGVDRAVGLLGPLVEAMPADRRRTAPVRAALGGALARRGMDGSHEPDIAAGIHQLQLALGDLPPEHRQRPLVELDLAVALYSSFMYRQQLTDLDAAAEHLQACRSSFDEGTPAWVAATGVGAGILVARANQRQDPAQADEAVRLYQRCVEILPRESPLWPGVAHGLGMALLLRSWLCGRDEDRVAARPWLDQAVEGLDPDAPARRVALATAAFAGAVQEPELWRVEPEVFDQGIDRLREAVAAAGGGDGGERATHMASLGGMLFGRYLVRCGLGQAALRDVLQGRMDLGSLDLTVGDRAMADLDEAIQWMQDARAMTRRPAAAPWWPLVSMQLCMALRRRSVIRPADRLGSREVGLEGLRGYAWRVLLQAGTEDAMAAARDAARQAHEIASWCLDDDDLERAVQALESGRGLVLHAATASATVARQLREAGHEQLAGEWEAAVTTSRSWSPQPPAAPVPFEKEPDRLAGVPSDLRYRVLQVLEAAPDHLLVPPGTGEIATALRRMGADAFVYLVPGSELADEPTPPGGRAVVVPADRPVQQLHLPRLETGPGSPLDDYVAVLMERQRRDGRAAADRWLRALEALCDWAWPAAVGPLLEHTAGWRLDRPARLVLAPVGLLAQVPWHAARAPAGAGPFRYAVQSASISYAPSARLLCEAARRTVLGRNRRGVIVGDPTGSLPHALLEAQALYASYYPQARYLGMPDDLAGAPGTPEQLLVSLSAGAASGDEPAVVHLACHAFIEDAPTRSHLLLAGGEKLTISDLLLQARGRHPDADGATVTLAACTTNLAGRQHDESLTLATAFMVAGAASVVGSLWKVPDLRTSLLMFMVHHYLNEGGMGAGEALRRAQLWMLDPDREPPAGMPEPLASHLRTVDCTALDGWAGFTHQGW